MSPNRVKRLVAPSAPKALGPQNRSPTSVAGRPAMCHWHIASRPGMPLLIRPMRTKKHPQSRVFLFGAQDRNRTGMRGLASTDFKSVVSTYFTTRADQQRRIFPYSGAQQQTEELSAQPAGCWNAAFR